MHLKDDNNVAIKIRVASTSQKIGKSGAYRMICYAEKEDGKITTSFLSSDIQGVEEGGLIYASRNNH